MLSVVWRFIADEFFSALFPSPDDEDDEDGWQFIADEFFSALAHFYLMDKDPPSVNPGKRLRMRHNIVLQRVIK